MSHLDCAIDELLTAAKRAGVRFAVTRPTLTVWGETTAETDAIATALRLRADEIVEHLRTDEPVTLDTDDSDVPTGTMPLSVLKANVIGWVFDTLEVIEGERAWERQIAGRDDQPESEASQPATATRPTGRYSLREGGRRG